jgi:hypothetical protein
MTRNLLNFGTLIAACTVALLSAACAGKVIPGPGGGESQLQSVSVNAVSGTLIACDEGFAHPNVCCEAVEGKPTSCGVYEGAPFHTCDASHTTYPDPRSCCPLDASGGADCVAPPHRPVPVPPPVCGYACPLGQYQPAGASLGTCCESFGDAIACSAPSVPACPIVACTCACNAGEPCPPCNCPEQPACPPPPTPIPDCGVCPAGWQVPEGEAYLCCKEDPSGAIECFSQGVPPSPTPIGAPEPVNPGGPVVGGSAGSGAGSSSGGSAK